MSPTGPRLMAPMAPMAGQAETRFRSLHSEADLRSYWEKVDNAEV